MEDEQNKMQEWQALKQKFSTFHPEFSPGFEQKVMQKLAVDRGTLVLDIIPVFRVFALSGIAAIGLLMIGLYFSNGSLDLDSLLGISGYTPDMGLLSFL